MEETTEKPVVSTKENPIPTGRGGWRGGLRPKVAKGRKAVTKATCLYPEEWDALEQHAARLGITSATKLIAQIARQYIHQNAPKLDRFNS